MCMLKLGSDPWATTTSSNSKKVVLIFHLDAYVVRSKMAPRFLLPILQEVVETGKSVELLRSLGKLRAVTDGGYNVCFIWSFKLGPMF